VTLEAKEAARAMRADNVREHMYNFSMNVKTKLDAEGTMLIHSIG
jgi:hypothetical protein